MKKARIIGALACAAALVPASTALAATEVVTQNSPSWSSVDTRPGGTVAFTEQYGAPSGLGAGSLKLTTDGTNAAKADLWTLDPAGTPLSSVTDLSYWTYQASGPPTAAPSYQLLVDLDGSDGTTNDRTILVYEPYWNGIVAPSTWQQWDVDAGRFWSSRTAGGLVAGAGGPPLYTLAQVLVLNPEAAVLRIGVNVGSFNPNYVVAADGVTFNDTTYDFELGRRPATKDECKGGNWASFNDPTFKNQGDCVSYVATGGRS